MAELEKKLSDYQKSECKEIDQQQEQPFDAKLCPTCIKDPTYVAPIWEDEEDPYLDKSLCEYHARILLSELEVPDVTEYSSREDFEAAVIELGMNRILQYFDKPLNNAVRNRIRPTAFIADESGVSQNSLGPAFKVAIPAFNFDQVTPDDETDNDETYEEPSTSEFILEVNGLNRKIRQLRLALETYKFYYASARSVSKDFVIRQESDELARLNYAKAVTNVSRFKMELNKALSDNGYAKINHIGAFKRRVLKIKFLFKDGDTPYDLNQIWVWPENSCDEYVKLRIGKGSPLRDYSFATTYHFMANLEKVINDITAKETKPWLDFTLEHFYPQYIADYGDISDLEETRDGLGCLIEASLGLEPGKIVDSLTDEIMSAFATAADEYAKEACRGIGDKYTESPTGKKLQEAEKKSSTELREEQAQLRYKNEYINKFYKHAFKTIQDERDRKFNELAENSFEDLVERPQMIAPTESNIFMLYEDELGKASINDFYEPGYSYYSKVAEKKVSITESLYHLGFTNTLEVEQRATAWAATKHENKKAGNLRDNIGNSPHFQEAMDAKDEIFEKFEKTYVDGFKDITKGAREIDPLDFITSIGVCGVSKMAGTALKCLVGGVTIEQFTSIIIEKFFEFVNMNTFALFFNDLPANFRRELNEKFSEQFGDDVELSNLIGLVVEMQGSSTMSQVSGAKAKAKEIVKLYEKYESPYRQISGDDPLNPELITLNYIGPNNLSTHQYFQLQRDIFYNLDKKLYKEGKFNYNIEKLEKKKEAKDAFLWIVKKEVRDYEKSTNKYRNAIKRMARMFDGSSQPEPPPEVPPENAPQPAATPSPSATVDELSQQVSIEVLKAELETLKTRLAELDQIREQAIEVSNIKTGSDDYASDYKWDQSTNTISYTSPETGETVTISESNSFYTVISEGVEWSSTNDEQEIQRILSENEQEIQGTNSRIKEIETVLQTSEATAVTPNQLTETPDLGQASLVEDEELIVEEQANYTRDPSQPSEIEQAALNFQETALGAKVDVIFDVVFDFIVDEIKDFFSYDELMAILQNYPMADLLINSTKDLFERSCPISPLFVPPVGDFMKSLTLDVCDLGESSLTLPSLNMPTIDWRHTVSVEFSEIFREAIIKLVSDLILSLVNKILALLESSLCNAIEAVGGMAADAIKNGSLDGLTDSFLNALNEAFCNDGDDPETARQRAEELVDALFSPVNFGTDSDPVGSGAKIGNVISSVASTEEILEAIVNPGGESNDQFTRRVSTAIRILVPEARYLLGDQNAVEIFFKNLGSYLPIDEKNRIRDLLAAGIPNLPISSAICLTNDQLDEWNRLRQALLEGPGYGYGPGYGPGYTYGDGSGDGDFRTPEEIVTDLNNRTREALEGIVDDISNLASDGGPFLGAATNEAMKDVCNPENVFNDVSMSEADKEYEDDVLDDFYNNLTRNLMWGFSMFPGGLLVEALRDKEGRREITRSLLKIFNPNYGNSTEEQILKFENKGLLTKFVMNTLGEDDDGDGTPDVQGDFPATVGIAQRKEILESQDGVKLNLGPNRQISTYKYKDGSEDEDYMYMLKTRANGLRGADPFGYRLTVEEEIYEDKTLWSDTNETDVILKIDTSKPVSDNDKQFIESYLQMAELENGSNARRKLMNQIFIQKSGINREFGSAYDLMYAKIENGLVEGLLTNYDKSDMLPDGYKYGYVSETITKNDFEYRNPGTTEKYSFSESDKVLGEFANDRIVALDPAVYGGRYSNPPFYIEPRQYNGWLEVAVKAFESVDGCDPKTPALFDFSDIKERTKTLGRTIKNDHRLSKHPDCVRLKPFNMLLDAKTKAGLDGIVRSTVRTYIAEYVIRGYGLFSNLQLRDANFDNSLGTYMVQKMKKDMMELGTFTSNRKIRIVRERYWYTFLEQCVEAYRRMVDIDKLIPPPEIEDAMNKIQLGMDKYINVDRRKRKVMRKNVPSGGIQKPPSDYDPLDIINNTPSWEFSLQAVAYRLTPQDERETFFDGGVFRGVNKNDIRFATIKKLEFFQKIYFIALFEKEATLIMSEFVNMEAQRTMNTFVDGLRDKPYYYDLFRGMLTMPTIFENTQVKVGLNDFYTKKQLGVIDTGIVQDVPVDNSATPGGLQDEIRLLIERYVRIQDKPATVSTPIVLVNRGNDLRGVVSIQHFDDFVSDNLDSLDDLKLSDVFGSLQFSYTKTLGDIFETGYTSAANISTLKLLNQSMEDEITRAITYFSFNRVPEEGADNDILSTEVVVDSSFIAEGEEIEPSGTIGSLGVRYGLRISAVLPQSYFSDEEQVQMLANQELSEKSIFNKSYQMQDGGFMFPIVSSEVDAIDCEFEDFSPLSGENSYDLECLINKMVDTTEFKMIFENCFDIKRISSMLGIYCVETMPAAIGIDETERNDPKDPDVDDWDKVTNEFAKNHLRREFKSHYLSSLPDGQTGDDDDSDRLSNLFKFSNPFDFDIKFGIPWWKRRRQKYKIYDRNSMECADPKKDLQ